jgi:hypothetical protein
MDGVRLKHKRFHMRTDRVLDFVAWHKGERPEITQASTAIRALRRDSLIHRHYRLERGTRDTPQRHLRAIASRLRRIVDISRNSRASGSGGGDGGGNALKEEGEQDQGTRLEEKGRVVRAALKLESTELGEQCLRWRLS